MLKYFKDNDLVLYPQEQPATWEEAIRMSCHKLEEGGYVTEVYADSIIKSVNEFGPYIVLLPGVAMPHAAVTSPGVSGTAVALTVFKDEVAFYDNDAAEEKPAKLFFTIVAEDDDKHLENITNLMTLLQNEETLEALLKSGTIEDFNKLI